MSAPSQSSSNPLSWTDVFRREVATKAFASLQSKPDLAASLQKHLSLPSSSFSTVDELHTAFASSSWYDSSKDLNDFFTSLDAAGVYPVSFTGFRWDWTEAALNSFAAEITHRTLRVLNAIAALKVGEHTFANTLQALSDNDRIVDVWSNHVTFLAHVSASKPIRDVSTEVTKQLSEFEVSQGMRVELYDAFKAFSETAEAKALTGENARLLEFTLRDFRRNGLHLPAEQRARIEAIKKKMSGLGITFQQNLGEENAKFEFTKEQLGGVPDDQLSRFPKSKTDDSKYVVSLKYPDYMPLMEMCFVEETRKKLEFEFNSRCIKENVPILEELVELRAEQAAILGYKNHAAYVLETRMAKTPEKVLPFLNELSKKLTPLMEEELTYWKQLKTEEKKSRNEPIPAEGVSIEAYDFRFYTRLSELKKYNVDDQKIKQYFPIEVVTAGLLDIYQRALGFKFVEIKDRSAGEVWHEEVQLFQVNDDDTGKTRGYFYLDLHPREGKYGHAAVFGLKAGCAKDASGVRQLPVAGMVCNFTKATPEQPSLFTHQEVVTFFHEFGHVMHQLCSEVTHCRFAGTSVERDFVEAPSQMLENWCYEREPLLLMSGHVNNHAEKLPEELLASIIASKKANAGLFNKRQCILALFDQTIHSQPQANTSEVWQQVNQAHWPIQPTKGTNFAAGFGHLAGGYDAQYYGYMWSEVYSADMFESRWKKEGLLNVNTGKSYRKEVIARGGSVDATELLKNFLGREPNDLAFLRSKGLSI